MSAQTNKFKRAAKIAKGLYKTGRYNKYSDAMKAAFKKIGTTTAKPVRSAASKKVTPVKKSVASHNSLSGVGVGAMKTEIKKRINGSIDKALVKKYRSTKKTVKRKLQREITNLKKELRKLI